MTTPPVVLSIAGTDSGGAAGLAADLATFAALGAHGACVVTAVTAQDTTGVHAIHPVPVDVVDAQLSAVLDDLPVAAIKAGMLGSAEVVTWLAHRVVRLGVTPASLPGARPTLVVDPVLRATSGAVLADEAVVAAYRERLFPVATVVTPNAGEARALLGLADDDGTPSAELARQLAVLGPAVVVTGGPEPVGPEPVGPEPVGPEPVGPEPVGPEPVGPEPGDTGESCTDWLAVPGEETVPLTHPAVPTSNDHGTGCTFSAALAVALARGAPLPEAVRRAADHTTTRLALSRHWELGRGRGPIGHTTTHTGDES